MRGYLFGILSAVFWALSGLLYNELPLSEYTALGKVISLLFLIDFCSLFVIGIILWRKSAVDFQGVFWKPALSGILGGPIGMSGYLLSIHYLTIYYAAPLSSLFPVIAALMSYWILKEKISKTAQFGFGLAVIASALLAIEVGQKANFNTSGLIFLAICILGWSSEIVISSHTMRSLSGLQVYFLRLCGSTLGYLLILLVLFLQGFPVDLFDFSYAQISGVITFGALSYCFYYQAIYLLKPIKAMALNITYSVWAIGLGYLLYKQPIKPITLLLTLLLSAGVIVTLYYKGEQK
ncbi:DMT family transporter [Haemophilus influenzae]|uniref:EamA-like transporter family protein n=4 Tax=Haemophilus influenzae TaxID=727 RepID=A0A2S9S207_HAEIF|nr:DMT family transporter [Haemophilus influenzae]EEW77478.1 LicB protein [Haemophilus influenzae NT127]MCK8830503.1 DMT family transporter [Haemophilus influenzae]MCK8841427.1 DMT family transporter [Haemophilus influenzae]MCK8925396.1 DMT family transporter [Haemophilus influenzae]MCK8931201.1 DMT family transporter [Haemophilus influenzae]